MNEIFSDLKKLRIFLLGHRILPEAVPCNSCNSNLKICKYDANDTSIYYRCGKRGCQNKFSCFGSNMPLTRVVHIIYFLMLDTNYYQLNQFFFIADSTIARYKDLLLTCYEKYIYLHPVFLGGENVIVEVDESVISRRGIIRCPTSHDDITLDTIWILGGIDRTEDRNFFLMRVENRTAETLTESMRYLILNDSILYTDGHASYPPTAASLDLEHHVVNHSEGFRASDGTHTNNIEGFWAHMKSTMRKENGVHRDNVDNWLIQYTFKRRYVLNKTPEEFAEIFIEILKLFFKLNY